MRINVKVIPSAKNAEVLKVDDLNYRVRVDAPPVGGKANIRLIDIMAIYFDVPKSKVRIIRGFGSRNKTLEMAAE